MRRDGEGVVILSCGVVTGSVFTCSYTVHFSTQC